MSGGPAQRFIFKDLSFAAPEGRGAQPLDRLLREKHDGASWAEVRRLIETGKVILESGKGYGKPVVVDTIGAGDLLGWSWMFPPYAWQFTARAAEPTRAIFFTGPVLREYCERDHSLGYQLLKRLTVVMNRRMQNARRKMLDVHSGKAFLEPVVLQPPFLDQELDTYPEVAASETREAFGRT